MLFPSTDIRTTTCIIQLSHPQLKSTYESISVFQQPADHTHLGFAHQAENQNSNLLSTHLHNRRSPAVLREFTVPRPKQSDNQ